MNPYLFWGIVIINGTYITPGWIKLVYDLIFNTGETLCLIVGNC